MITLQLHSEIFSVDNIEYTKEAYADFANINFKSENNYWLVTFSDCKYDEKETIKAFENYLIGLENS